MYKISVFANLMLLLGAMLALSACKKDNTTEQEIITTVVVHLNAADGSLDKEFTWEDLDGDGGQAPVVDDIVLAANKTYHTQVHFYDRSKSPAVDVTAEVEAESAAHLLVYTISGANITITPDDQDANGKPFRLETTWATGAASTGNLTLQLRHEPDKSAANPDITGDLDAEAAFVVKVQ